VINTPHDEAAVLEAVVVLLIDEGIDPEGFASTRVSMAAKMTGDEAAAAGDQAAAVAVFTRVCEGTTPMALLDEARARAT